MASERRPLRDNPGGRPPAHTRALELIEELGLLPHPEGGHYLEIFRSSAEVQPGDSRPPRAALTTILFLLRAGDHSRWHRVLSDEAWHFQEGDPLELFWVDREENVHREVLSSGGRGARHATVVPAGCWQAARPMGAYALVGCTVGPGFDFDDFEMITGPSPALAALERLPGFPRDLT
jgi:uncharacterized protein